MVCTNTSTQPLGLSNVSLCLDVMLTIVTTVWRQGGNAWRQDASLECQPGSVWRHAESYHYVTTIYLCVRFSLSLFNVQQIIAWRLCCCRVTLKVVKTFLTDFLFFRVRNDFVFLDSRSLLQTFSPSIPPSSVAWCAVVALSRNKIEQKLMSCQNLTRRTKKYIFGREKR